MTEMVQSSAAQLPSSLEEIRALLAEIPDPEIPVITIEELGILRRVDRDGGRIVVTITPTYSGCPAMEMICGQIIDTLAANGIEDAQVKTVYSPAWTTDWMSEAAKAKLDAYGVAPPGSREAVLCPRCRSNDVRTVSSFGSTACKALMVCQACLEPFDWFKAI